MDAPLALGDGDSLHPVDATLELQPRPRCFTGLGVPTGLHGDPHVLVAAEVGLGGVEHLGAPAPALGVAQVHPQQVTREQGRLLASLTGLHLEDDVAVVVGITRDEQAAQSVLGGGERGLQGGDLVGERRVLRGELARGLDVVARGHPGVVGSDRGAECGIALVQLTALVRVGGDRRVGHLRLERGVLGDQGLG